MSTTSICAILSNSPDLLDPFAGPIEWREPTNGIEVVPPLDWHEGDPSLIPTYALEPGDRQYANLSEAATPAARLVPGLAIVPKRKSLLDHIGDTDAIYDALEGLNAEDLDEDAREELSRMLIASITGTKTKIDSMCSVLAAFEAAEAAAKVECERSAKRVKYFVSQRERLEGFGLFVLTTKGLKRIDGNTSSISVRVCPAKLVIENERLIPAEFLRWPDAPPPPPAVPDNAIIKAALKLDPGAVPGCRLVQREKLYRS
jgi:hypothetical protein